MKKLVILCRDGLRVKDFVNYHNLSPNEYKRVKKFDDLVGLDISGYVVMKPYGCNFDELLQYLEVEEYENKTKYYATKSTI